MSHPAPATPRDAFDHLLAGNLRFAAGTPRHPHQDAAHRADPACAQRPFAVLLGCSDSRPAAEIIFDQGLGDLFVVRTAGHAAGPEVLGSIEYGVSVLDCPLVVVLGHDACGAVTATRAAGVGDDDGSIDTHVRQTVDFLLERSRELADQVAAGRTAVVGLSYRLAEGTARLVVSRGLDLPSDAAAAAR
ncbi:carbonic anhydrase [Streptomyces monashensis]|uniref:carbonic anhydrase n=1 Tax=Streptomyces monashensis TaxID=1678012 RepID=UPI0033F2C4D6